MYVCVHLSVCRSLRRSEEASDPSELGSEMVVNSHMGAGNQIGSSEEQLLLLTTEPAPSSYFSSS